MNQAMPRGVLDVYLNDEQLGAIDDRTMGFVAFDFTEAAVDRHGIGSRVLSLSIPVSRDTVDPFVATPFFAGLLPEGDARTRLCEEFRVSPDDPFALLTVLGRESAGALVIAPPGEAPRSTEEMGVRALDDLALAAELDRLALTPLGVTVEDDEIRLSLAGVQEKLPLVQLDGGRLGLPLHGHPSTHIAKPARRADRFPELVQNEAFCLEVAAALDIPTAAFSVIAPGGEPVLLVERYDRARDADGAIVRLHQEDACQATGRYPATKYEIAGGPSLADVAELIGDHSSQPAVDRMTLMRLTTLNAVLGNCDAHGKNLSFLHGPGGVRLAPAYDLVSTEAYAHTDTLGMRIGGVDRLRDLDREALLVQADAIGVPRRLGERIVGELADAFPAALDSARERAVAEGWLAGVIDRVIVASRKRAERLLGVGG
jgi:serine/threonine-protein kinase HipA